MVSISGHDMCPTRIGQRETQRAVWSKGKQPVGPDVYKTRLSCSLAEAPGAVSPSTVRVQSRRVNYTTAPLGAKLVSVVMVHGTPWLRSKREVRCTCSRYDKSSYPASLVNLTVYPSLARLTQQRTYMIDMYYLRAFPR